MTVEVELERGIIRWFINGGNLVEVSSEILKDANRLFVPFAVLYHKGDVVEYLH